MEKRNEQQHPSPACISRKTLELHDDRVRLDPPERRLDGVSFLLFPFCFFEGLRGWILEDDDGFSRWKLYLLYRC